MASYSNYLAVYEVKIRKPEFIHPTAYTTLNTPRKEIQSHTKPVGFCRPDVLATSFKLMPPFIRS